MEGLGGCKGLRNIVEAKDRYGGPDISIKGFGWVLRT